MSTISEHWTLPFHLPVSWPVIPTDTGTGKGVSLSRVGTVEFLAPLSFLGSPVQAYVIQTTLSCLLLHLCSSASGAPHPKGMAMPKKCFLDVHIVM